ncbi:hypothetical protein CC78DRAFT_84856 [Lojkania enalia]|uniref:Nucleoside 2-deoxyribosyltransferase n=1 Tax=Lojkania enalia TaxID=147567 RepID=A0A9P4N568_9PLEO|nr:hypothetical protein CC78DRAFT_84856 [Didymosphaeria enalia]
MSIIQSPGFVEYKAPFKPELDKPSVILFGSIERNVTAGWQAELSSALSDLPIAILNPLREDWDSSWVEDISFPKFREQVEWEMEYAQKADVIAVYFAPDTLAPISLLELGMYAGTGKAIVGCPKGFYKRGNVQMVCIRYDIPLVDSKQELKDKVRQKLVEKLGDDKPKEPNKDEL